MTKLLLAISYLRGLLYVTCRGAQPLRERLQELPSDRSVPFDKWAELPESKPIANQLRCRGDSGRTRPAVDQRDLAEIIAGTEGRNVDAFARHPGLPGIDDEEGGAPGS